MYYLVLYCIERYTIALYINVVTARYKTYSVQIAECDSSYKLQQQALPSYSKYG